MENMAVLGGDQDPMDLPPGFRFHPTDEELITHYLAPKVVDVTFSARAIGEVDLNKCEPWDLPKRAKMGEKEWYFFCVRDRKYPTGLRTNRATEAGYWKATGKDKEIYRGKSLVGMKKTLVFYKGRAPKGEKSNWVMHEYRLEGKSTLSSNAKNEWVICRIFQKSSSGKKIPFPGLMRPDAFAPEFNPSTNLPPLMEASPYSNNYNGSHVTCFSNPMDIPQTSHYNNNNNDQPSFDMLLNNTNNNPYNLLASNLNNENSYYPRYGGGSSFYPNQTGHYPEQHILRAIIENDGTGMKTEVINYSASQDTGMSSDINPEISSYNMGPRSFEDPDGPAGPVDLDSIWNY